MFLGLSFPIMIPTSNSHVLYIRFDLADFSRKGPEDEVGMLKSVKSLNEIISEEIDNGIPASRIVLGGFSQGAVMTLLTGLTSERKLAGLAVLSGRVPLMGKFKSVGLSFLVYLYWLLPCLHTCFLYC